MGYTEARAKVDLLASKGARIDVDLHPQTLARRHAGFSLLELVCALSVLLAATLGFSRVLAASLALSEVERERERALEAAHQVLEEMRDRAFADVLRLYDARGENDPGGAGTAPGASFVVAGLEAQDGDGDGRAGEVLFPIWDEELREDVYAPNLGMPQDLDGDDALDDADHAAHYQLLPVLVRVAWKGRNGPMQVELGTLLAER